MPEGAGPRGRWSRAIVEYDGTDFSGSQYQPNARTVQGELESALNRLTGERVRVRFAGRTDAGVHATGQVVAFCLPPRAAAGGWSWAELERRLNAILPDDLAVRRLRGAAASFDPRRDARRRAYRYRILTGGVRHPLERHRTLEVGERLDVAAMQAAGEGLLGEHDFGAFGSDPAGWTRRRLTQLRVRRRGPLVEVIVVGDAFLRRMVRSIVAVLLEVGRGQLAPHALAGLLSGGARALHGRAAPARGLTLERVAYATESGTGTKRTGAVGRRTG